MKSSASRADTSRCNSGATAGKPSPSARAMWPSYRRARATAGCSQVVTIWSSAAYPPEGTYDECRSEKDYAEAVFRIPKAPRPLIDPVFGQDQIAAFWMK